MLKKTDIIIIGMGPVGAYLAALCGQISLSVRVLEKEAAVYDKPRAIVLDFEVLRLLNYLGVAEDILKTSVPALDYDFLNKDFEILSSRLQPQGVSPTGYHFANLFYQPEMEVAVRKKITELPNIEVTLNCEAESFTQSDEGVSVMLRTADGVETIEGKYLVGCDGARSMTRTQLGIKLEDLNFNKPWMVVDTYIPAGQDTISKNAQQLCDPERPTTCVPSGLNRRRWEFMLKPHEQPENVTQIPFIKELIRPWIDPDKVEIVRNAVYQFNSKVANKWRDGRVLLAGDAAHQMPPFMGQGLCAGIRDAANLAWKLGAVIKGTSPESLLDTLQIERRPHVRAVTQGAITMGEIVCLTDPVKVAERDRKMIESRKSGKQFELPVVPKIEHGILSDPSAGHVLPEGLLAIHGEHVRVDDITGMVPLLIIKDVNNLTPSDWEAIELLQAQSPNLRLCHLEGDNAASLKLLDPHKYLHMMMENVKALLSKPDRIIFGSGSLPLLAEKWRSYNTGIELKDLRESG
ncbi:MAG: bifunctional 3-(3-hydroxy-phenyl)propionate/3-hydroxycinnamic acid hydroxylase [Candidatus Micropelagos thuwalensis]